LCETTTTDTRGGSDLGSGVKPIEYRAAKPVGQVANLRSIGNRPSTFLRILPSNKHSLSVTTFHSRRLPHYHAIGQPIFLTWRLYGSLPANRSFPAKTNSGKAFVAMDRLLDHACTGPLFLRIPQIASMVTASIRHRDPRHYQLHAYAVMPNHVHLLITPIVEVSKIMQSLKRFTAREGNRILNFTGQPFWQEESYDRLVRNETEFQRILQYIETNPVKSGLAATPEEFEWSSAGPIPNRPQDIILPYGAVVIP
jgi:REP element-mobilizing transposase RayT